VLNFFVFGAFSWTLNFLCFGLLCFVAVFVALVHFVCAEFLCIWSFFMDSQFPLLWFALLCGCLCGCLSIEISFALINFLSINLELLWTLNFLCADLC